MLTWSPGRPLVMGIVNVTPDSFSGDGLHLRTDAAFDQAMRMMAAGADLIDVGAESTRPGAQAVSLDEELNRLLPLLERLAAANVPVSVDTTKAQVMAESIRRGAGMINDVTAGRPGGSGRAGAAGAGGGLPDAYAGRASFHAGVARLW